MSKLLDVLTGKSSLWPMGRSDVLPTNNSLRSTTSFGLPFISWSVFKDTPYWQELKGLQDYFHQFVTNPVLFAVIMIKAREYANMRFVVKNRRTGKVEPEKTLKEIPKKIYGLLNKPNVLQKRWEFLWQRKIFREVCGNTFTYRNAGFGVKQNINNIVALWNVWPQYMQYKLGDKYFDATEIRDIVNKWRFEFADYKKEFEPEEILHQNAPNLDPRAGRIFGTPTAFSLSRPLTNIALAYESTNIIMQNRGARLLFTSNKGDTSGKVPLTEKEKKELDEQAKMYGTLEGQRQFWFSHLPINITAIEQDIRKLGIREEVAVDTMLVAHAFGVPEILVKLYLQGATFENQEASVRRLYQGTLIPESEDDIIALNEFLGLADSEWVVEGSFEHVAALQQSKKDSSTANKTTSEYMEKLFIKGGCTLNQWRAALEMDPIESKESPETESDQPTKPIGDKYIFEFTPEELDIVFRAQLTVPGEDPETEPTEEDPAQDEEKNLLKVIYNKMLELQDKLIELENGQERKAS